MRNKRRGQKNRIPGTITFHRWIRNAIASGMPFDRFVRSILTATGNVSVSPPVQWYAEVRFLDRYVDDTAQVFLGLRIGFCPMPPSSLREFHAARLLRAGRLLHPVARREGIGVAERRANETVFIKATGSVKHPITGEVSNRTGWGLRTWTCRLTPIPGTGWSTGWQRGRTRILLERSSIGCGPTVSDVDG
ncbi:MAG: hypothetical protein CM1200mP2_02840 [Planctomycetaceae bacterium]|nr:MAG: hypothetical protein CM1200mP2_02840 [Planctomycetaceae bacterium]